jgi:hypothetical protein
LFIVSLALLYALTIMPSTGSSGTGKRASKDAYQNQNQRYSPHQRRVIRSLRKRAANDSLSSAEGTTTGGGDLLSETTTMPPPSLLAEAAKEDGGPVMTAPEGVAAPEGRKVSIRARFRPFELPANYSKTVIPSPHAANIHKIDTSEELLKYKEGVTPVVINVGIKVESVSVAELDQELILALQLFLKWDDSFIQQDNNKDSKYTDGSSTDNYRTLDPEFAEKIWKPDLFLENLIEVNQPKLISQLLTLNINPYTGTIIYISRMTIKIACSMDFQYYPVDTQACEIKLRSNSYISGELLLKWEDVVLLDTSEPNFDVQLSDFDSYLHIEEFIGFFYKQISTLKFTILAKRKISYHMVQSYLPSVFFVWITWICFMIPYTSADIRIGVAMTTLLTLTAMFAAIRESTPIVSYVKAIDIWMAFCIFIVFLTLLDFVITVYLNNQAEAIREQRAEEEKINASNGTMDTTTDNGSEIGGREVMQKGQDRGSKSSKKADLLVWVAEFMEKWAFAGFAGIFFLFNVIYWWWLFGNSEYFDWNVESDLNEI